MAPGEQPLRLTYVPNIHVHLMHLHLYTHLYPLMLVLLGHSVLPCWDSNSRPQVLMLAQQQVPLPTVPSSQPWRMCLVAATLKKGFFATGSVCFTRWVVATTSSVVSVKDHFKGPARSTSEERLLLPSLITWVLFWDHHSRRKSISPRCLLAYTHMQHTHSKNVIKKKISLKRP